MDISNSKNPTALALLQEHEGDINRSTISHANDDMKIAENVSEKNKKPLRSPKVLHSLSADPYAPYPNSSPSTHHTLNLTNFPIPETIDMDTKPHTIIHKQPPIKSTASAPETYYNHNGFGTNYSAHHQHAPPTASYHHRSYQSQSNMYQYHQHYHQYYNESSSSYYHHQSIGSNEEYTIERLHKMYREYHDYYNKYQQQQQNKKQNPQIYNKSHTQTHSISDTKLQRTAMSSKSNEESLKKIIKQQNEKINSLQTMVSALKHKLQTINLSEHTSFHSFLSRIEFPQNISAQQRSLCLHKLFEHECAKLSQQQKIANRRRQHNKSINLTLEKTVISLTDQITHLRDELEQQKHANYLRSVEHNKALAQKLNETKQQKQKNDESTFDDNGDDDDEKEHKEYEYPSENVIICNLIRTQIEFYFSDYNLKRDKRLLDQLCSDRIGYLKVDSVMNLTRVRQLCAHKNQIISALKSSSFLTLTSDNEWIGRKGFERPIEKIFPFRRTVFVFGLPLDCNEKYVEEMLCPFGKLSKIKFDHGPDTLDRLVLKTMFNEIKVFQYRDLGSKELYNYKVEMMVGGSLEYKCIKCKKMKICEEGFYETHSYANLICLQCVAAAAECILERAQNKSNGNKRMIELLCGKSPRKFEQCRTALAVFTSQRQASKCVYVRSRIGFDGCFATHYHHYSKLKKEIALNMQPFDVDKLRQIPHKCMEKKQLSLRYDGVGCNVEDEDGSSGSELCDMDIDVDGDSLLPALTKKNKGAMTAPVVSNDGVYLMRDAYKKVAEK